MMCMRLIIYLESNGIGGASRGGMGALWPIKCNKWRHRMRHYDAGNCLSPLIAGDAAERAGVMLLDLAAEGAEQGLLFAKTPGDTVRSNRLMTALDRINRTRGRGAVHYAGEGLGERWRMRQGRLSAASTLGWAGLPAVR